MGSRISGTNGSFGDMLLIARTRFAETAVDELASSCVGSAARGVAAVVAAGAGALLDDVSEPFSSFGSWKASSAAKTTIRPTSDQLLPPLGGVLGGLAAGGGPCVDRTHQGVPPAASAVLEVEVSVAASGVATGVAAAGEPLYLNAFMWTVAVSCGSCASPGARFSVSTLKSRPEERTRSPATRVCVRSWCRKRWIAK